jgi:hypothetical protein
MESSPTTNGPNWHEWMLQASPPPNSILLLKPRLQTRDYNRMQNHPLQQNHFSEE